MRKLVLALLLLLAAPAFAQNPLLPGNNAFSCFVENVTATTQCQVAPAANLTIHITGFTLSNEAGTAQSLDIIYGTGTNCGTGTAAATHKIAFPASIGTVSGNVALLTIPAGVAVCIRPTAATAFGATLSGYIAP